MILGQQPSQKFCIVVLGMHRSGTSALAGCLNLLGVQLGADLIPAHPEINAKGHWEHREAVALNERALNSLGRTWQDERPLPENWTDIPAIAALRSEIAAFLLREFSHIPFCGLKDPRLCRLLPLWLEAIAETEIKPVFILALRHPVEVARSLASRDGIPEARAYLLWLDYMLEAERASRGYPRFVVDYATLLSDWRSALDPLSSHLGLDLSLDLKEVRDGVEGFLSPNMRHFSSCSDSVSAGPCHDLAVSTYRAFLDYADNLPLAIFDDLHYRTEGICRIVTPWAKQIQNLLRDKADRDRELTRVSDRDALLAEVSRLKSTVSWRITKPLRLVANLPHMLLRKCRHE